jgi:flagellar assembly protein FliH
MSCKVISGRSDVVAQPVFRTDSRSTEPKPLFRTDTRSRQDTQTPELRVLQDRVAQLEGSLQSQLRQARDAGFKEGEAAGRESARSELQPLIERLNQSLTALATLRSRIRQDSEAELVKLSLCIARRVLRRELTIDPDAVHGLVKAAFDKVQGKDIRKVRVHPDFQSIIRHHVEINAFVSTADIVPDASLQPGDVVVETRLGDLDASVESQLKEIERGFADRLNR